MADTEGMAARALLSLPIFLLVACGGSSGAADPIDTAALADFALLDVNPTSQTFNTDVSPRDQQGKISAWYFGAAT